MSLYQQVQHGIAADIAKLEETILAGRGKVKDWETYIALTERRRGMLEAQKRNQEAFRKADAVAEDD